MTLTPRQIAAYLEFSDKLDRIELANQLTNAVIGAQGNKQAVEKRLKELSRPQGARCPSLTAQRNAWQMF